MKGCLHPFQVIVRLYQDSNLRRDEMKDDCSFRHTLAGFEPTLAIGLNKMRTIPYYTNTMLCKY